MSTTPSTREEKIIEDYFENGSSIQTIRNRYGISTSYLRKLVKTQKGRKRNNAPKRGTAPTLPLSKHHAWLGAKVAKHRNRLGLSVSAYGERIGLSRIALARVEYGTYSITLTNLVTLSEFMEVTMESLVSNES